MSSEQTEIRIYVACLASYNNGILHGAWIDACQDEEAVREEISAMLKASPIPGAEEYAIHDYEGFEGARIEEYQGIESVAEIAAFIGEHGALGGKLLEYFGDLDDARTAMEEDYSGEYSSLATKISENLQYYIDYERMGRDLEINDVLAVETGFEEVHIFWRR